MAEEGMASRTRTAKPKPRASAPVQPADVEGSCTSDDLPQESSREAFENWPVFDQEEPEDVAKSSTRDRGGRQLRPRPPLNPFEGVYPRTSVLAEDWTAKYETSDAWGAKWRTLHSDDGEWEQGDVVEAGKLYVDDLLCVPEALAQRLVKELHELHGHTGREALKRELERRYVFGNQVKVDGLIKRVRESCGVCQATEPPNWATRGNLFFTPVPRYVMDHVCIDIFSMPGTEYRDEYCDAMVLCVDRLSGWILGAPVAAKGLTGEVVANVLFDQGWNFFGVPSHITSDRGPQFVSTWWRTLCARLGIRMSYAHAYRHQGNGRAEVAGRHIQTVLRKLNAEQMVNWAEALPAALRLHNDRAGENGYSPYQLLFGRDRPLAGLPWRETVQSEEVQVFFDRLENQRLEAKRAMEKEHASRARILPESKRRGPFKVGERVWVRRPTSAAGVKLDTYWVGPARVMERISSHGYKVQVRPGVLRDVHVDQLKPCVVDLEIGEATPLYYYRTSEKEREVEEIKGHRWRNGRQEFLTKWSGEASGVETWEPADTFIPEVNDVFLRYAEARRLPMAGMLDPDVGHDWEQGGDTEDDELNPL